MTSQNQQSLEDLNKQVHELVYVEPGHAAQPAPDASKGKELAEKIRENIRAYQDEVSTQQRPHLQT